MRLPRLGAVVVLAALAASGAWGQTEVDELKKAKDGEKKEDAAGRALIEKKLSECPKGADCSPYVLEKADYLKKKKAKEKKDQEPLSPEEESAVEEAAPEAPDGAPVNAAAAGPAMNAPRRASAPPTAAQSEGARQAAGGRRERTMRRAAGAAEVLRRSLQPAEETGGNPGDDARTERPPRTADEPGRPPRGAFGLADPRTVPELALAQRTGFAATFRDQGLKVGAGPRGEPAIQRADGTPASEPELERLRTALREEPAALIRRPYFFEVLPRENFADLKRDFTERPALRSTVFKDIALTARERDFQWSASCSGLSGVCNPSAGAGSYRKGQDVPPEDLKAVWKAVRKESGDDEDEFGEYSEEDKRLASALDLAAEKLGSGRRLPKNLSALLARMGDMARDLGERTGLISVASPADEASFASSAGWSRGESAAGARRPAAAARQAAPGRSEPVPEPAPAGGPAAEYRFWFHGLAAVVAAALILRGLRKNARPGL